MKITPISSEQAGTSLAPSNEGRTADANALARAKAIAEGKTPPMKMSRADIPIDPTVVAKENNTKSIKLQSDYSPDRFNDNQVIETPVVEAGNAVSNDIEQANASEATKPLSPQFAELAKRRRSLQLKERELVDREKALEAKGSQTGSEDLIARLKSQPLSVLQEYGVTYDQLTEAILANQGVNPEVQALKAEIKALKEGVDNQFKSNADQQRQAVISEMHKEAVMLAKADDTFEMVRETNSLPDVIKLIEKTYDTTGEILEVPEAMQLVEDDLINETMKIARLKKIQNQFQSKTDTRESVQQQPMKQMKTLTNRDTARPQVSRRDRMMAAFNGTLKK